MGGSKRTKGRGTTDHSSSLPEGDFESLDSQAPGEAVKSIEGWIVFLTGIHEEAEENELLDKLSDFGSIKNFQLQIDRRTGFVTGYALVEYEKREEAEAAIKALDNSEFMERTIRASWTFVGPPKPNA